LLTRSTEFIPSNVTASCNDALFEIDRIIITINDIVVVSKSNQWCGRRRGEDALDYCSIISIHFSTASANDAASKGCMHRALKDVV